jgi:hypothetical protein
MRSSWEGKLSTGSSGAISPSSCGMDWLQASDWAIWVTADAGWRDRPVGKPLVTSSEYAWDRAVDLTVWVSEDGSATWERGVATADW